MPVTAPVRDVPHGRAAPAGRLLPTARAGHDRLGRRVRQARRPQSACPSAGGVAHGANPFPEAALFTVISSILRGHE